MHSWQELKIQYKATEDQTVQVSVVIDTWTKEDTETKNGQTRKFKSTVSISEEAKDGHDKPIEFPIVDDDEVPGGNDAHTGAFGLVFINPSASYLKRFTGIR